MVEITPKSLWGEELPPGGEGAGTWEDLEDGFTTSRRAVLAPNGKLEGAIGPQLPTPPRDDGPLPRAFLSLSA